MLYLLRENPGGILRNQLNYLKTVTVTAEVIFFIIKLIWVLSITGHTHTHHNSFKQTGTLDTKRPSHKNQEAFFQLEKMVCVDVWAGLWQEMIQFQRMCSSLPSNVHGCMGLYQQLWAVLISSHSSFSGHFDLHHGRTFVSQHIAACWGLMHNSLIISCFNWYNCESNPTIPSMSNSVEDNLL